MSLPDPPTNRLSRPQRGAFISALSGWVFDYYEVFLLTMLVVPIAAEMHLSTGQTARIFSVQLLCMAVGGVLFGYLADRFGRRDVLMWTIVIYCVATVARSLAPNYPVLLGLTAVAAFGIGGEYGVGQTLVAELVPRARRGWWSGLLYGGIYIGIMLAAIVGGQITPHIGWRWTFVLSGLPVLVAIYVRRRAPESDVWERRRRDTPRIGLAPFRRRTFLVPFVMCLAAGTFQFFGYYGTTTFLPTYLADQGFDAAKASWWLFFTGIAGLVGCIVGATLSDRWGRRPTLCLLSGISAAAGVILFATWSSLLTSALLLVPFFFLFFGSNGATVFGALFSELFPTELRGTGVSASLQVARGLSAFPPLLSAWMLPRGGYASVVLLGAAWFLLLSIFSWFFRETRDSTIESASTVVRADR